jgi:hypothetical protein
MARCDFHKSRSRTARMVDEEITLAPDCNLVSSNFVREKDMTTRLKRTFCLAVILSLTGAAMAADPTSSGSRDSSPAPVIQSPDSCSGPSCIDGGDCHCADPGLQAGATWHILRPVINNNFAFVTISAPGTSVDQSTHNFRYKYDSGVSLWLGYTLDSGLGFRTTWFHLDADAKSIAFTNPFAGVITQFVIAGSFVGSGAAPLAAGQADVFNLGNSIRINSWDFDVTQEAQLGRIDLNLGAGLRYVRITQEANISRVRTGLPAGAVDTDSENDSSSFNGWGPTFFVEARRSIGCYGFGLYANVRGGILFGTRTIESLDTNTVGGGRGVITSTSRFSTDEERTIGLAEIELGVEWHRKCGRFNPFARGGFEGREYTNVGNVFGGGNNVGAYGLALSAGVGF